MTLILETKKLRGNVYYKTNVHTNNCIRPAYQLNIKAQVVEEILIEPQIINIGTIYCNKLIPTQSQIWLENIIPNIIKFGIPTDSSSIAKAVIIVSKEGYILDGHHRFGQAIIANPSLKMSSLYIPLKIDLLLAMGRSYGNAVGNAQKS